MFASLASFAQSLFVSLFGPGPGLDAKNGENEQDADEVAVDSFISAALHGNVTYLRQNIHMLNCQDELKNSALGSAAINNQVAVVKMILGTGDACHVDIPDSDSCTPSMLALGAGNQQICEMLLDSGASLKKKDVNGWTLLHHAAAGGNVKMLDRLVRVGMNVDDVAAGGQNCLYMAAYGGHLAAVDFLLHHGLDPRIEDSNNDKAADVTESEEVQCLLQKYEDDLNARDQKDEVVIDTNETGPLLGTDVATT